MDIHLLIDFGSTYTKIIALDLAGETFLGRAQALTTIETDITIGLNNFVSGGVNQPSQISISTTEAACAN